MKVKFISAIILIDIALIVFVAYMLVQYNRTDGGTHDYIDGLNVTLYAVAISDSGVNGEVIGCGDSLVPAMNYQSDHKRVTEALIVESLNRLLALSNESLAGGDQLSLYTAAYQPGLTLEGVERNGNVVNVFMSGNLVFGTVCDTPRFEKQLERTVTQFEEVDYARFYLNGSEENFRKALSGR